MKFFWKIYLCTMMITMACFSIGGYMLIQQGFQSSLNREIQNAYKNNDIITSIMNEMSGLDRFYQIDEKNQKEILSYELSNYSIQNNTNILFCLKNNEGQIIYMDGSFQNNDTLIKELDQHKQGYRIMKNKNHYYIHTIKPFYDDLYIETKSDITSLFENRNHQFQLLFYYSIALLMISGIIIYIMTRWLVHPIQKLSQATQEMTIENHFDPISVKGNDEIAQLTHDFNTMGERMFQSIQELHETAERQNLFVGNFAHELKTPLTSIVGYSDLLQSKKNSEEQVMIYAHYIFQEARRLERLSMKLLELIVLKKNDFVFYEISAVSFLKDIENELKVSLDKYAIQLMTHYDTATLYIEPDLMKTVMINLIDNARKAIDHDGQIQIIAQQVNQDYHIQIKDNGCGIAKEDISKIMEAFYMVDKSRSRTMGGAGLGLAIVHEIIKLHNGDIFFDSILGEYTIVTVVLKGRNKS